MSTIVERPRRRRKRSAPIAVTILPLRELYTTYSGHSRLGVFAELGRKCVACPREGNVLLVSRDRGGGVHIDLYADHVLMTVDHIIPRSVAKRWNWSTASIESIRNKQPMCQPCDGKKGSKLPQSDRSHAMKYGFKCACHGVQLFDSMVERDVFAITFQCKLTLFRACAHEDVHPFDFDETQGAYRCSDCAELLPA